MNCDNIFKAILSLVHLTYNCFRYSSFATDVTFFLYTCADPEILNKRWDDLIKVYYDTFISFLQDLGSNANKVTLENMQSEIKQCGLFGVGMSMEAVVMANLDDDEVADLDGIKVSYILTNQF